RDCTLSHPQPRWQAVMEGIASSGALYLLRLPATPDAPSPALCARAWMRCRYSAVSFRGTVTLTERVRQPEVGTHMIVNLAGRLTPESAGSWSKMPLLRTAVVALSHRFEAFPA